jgi:2-amino-4-hydroxy-6-hydroxymethyldihydropteridine diphosphokinase/dihydropteroate synthase
MLVLGMGSNCGDRLQYLRIALDLIRFGTEFKDLRVEAISPIYESDALLPDNAPESWNQSFLNVNLLCKTEIIPQELLIRIKKIEAHMGRLDRGRWAPREIDIDILAYGDRTFKSLDLELPHPWLLERPFAILPLADIYPDWIIPGRGPFAGTNAENYAKQLRKSGSTIPFRTRRSTQSITQLMGILNVTPDSFSDGGLHDQPQTAIQQIETFIQNGVYLFDIGGESTRPGAKLLETEEEWRRIAPLLKGIQAERKHLESLSQSKIQLSIDTRNPEIAHLALQNGADWINDVSGFRSPQLTEFLAKTQAESLKLVKVVLMHSLSVPPKKDEILPSNADVLEQLLEWGDSQIQRLVRAGIARDSIVFDPGLGFGKSVEQSWELLRRAEELHKLRVPILIGHSRKSFLTPLTQKTARERDIETASLTIALAAKGISYLRVHHAEHNSRAIRGWTQVNGICR